MVWSSAARRVWQAAGFQASCSQHEGVGPLAHAVCDVRHLHKMDGGCKDCDSHLSSLRQVDV